MWESVIDSNLWKMFVQLTTFYMEVESTHMYKDKHSVSLAVYFVFFYCKFIGPLQRQTDLAVIARLVHKTSGRYASTDSSTLVHFVYINIQTNMYALQHTFIRSHLLFAVSGSFVPWLIGNGCAFLQKQCRAAKLCLLH